MTGFHGKLITRVLIFKMVGCVCHSRHFEMTVANYRLCHKLQCYGGVAVVVHSITALIATLMMLVNANFVYPFIFARSRFCFPPYDLPPVCSCTGVIVLF